MSISQEKVEDAETGSERTAVPGGVAKLFRMLMQSALVRQVSGSFALKVFFTLLTFVTGIVLAQTMGAEGYGYYTYALSWVSLLSFPAMLGLEKLLIREVARKKAMESWSELRGLIKWTDCMVLFSSLAAAGAAAGAVWFARGALDAVAVQSLLVAMIIIPFLAFLRIRQGAVCGLGHVVIAQVAQFAVRPVLFLILIAALALSTGLSAPVAVLARAVSVALALGISLVLLKRYMPGPARDVRPTPYSSIWLKSGLTFLAAGTASIVNERLSVILVGSLLGPEETAFFEAANRGALLITFGPEAVYLSIGPTVARLFAAGEKSELQYLITRSVRWTILAAVPILLAFVLLGRWYLFLFGEEFIAAKPVLTILCFSYLAHVAFGPTSLLLNMTGHERLTAVGVALAAVINAGLTLSLIPVLGVTGAALGQLGSVVFYKMLLAAVIHKRLGLVSFFGLPYRAWNRP